MPEGDTIHRTANRLRPALQHQALVAFEAPRLHGDRPTPGSVITNVDAVGKHLLVRFESGLVLHTHMKMTGAWHLYRAGQRWQKPRHLVRALLDVGEWVAVCFAAPIVQTFHESGPSSPVAHLGPDLCGESPDLDAALERMAAVPEPDASVCDVLLNQRVASGIGNVYKSEVLWAQRLSPFTPLAAIDPEVRRGLLSRAHRQLRSNLTTTSRRTVPGGLAVYDRQGAPCRQCDSPVRMQQFGQPPRSTYWCPICQPHPSGIDGRP